MDTEVQNAIPRWVTEAQDFNRRLNGDQSLRKRPVRKLSVWSPR